DPGNGEHCDDQELGDKTCADFGYYDAAGLTCNSLCGFDTSACTGSCGDELLNGLETCEIAPPPGQSCLDYGFDIGRLGCSAFCTPGFNGCTGIGWKSMYSPTSQHLQGVWGASPGDVYAVGISGTILHFDGTIWSQVASATSSDLYALWGSSSA